MKISLYLGDQGEALDRRTIQIDAGITLDSLLIYDGDTQHRTDFYEHDLETGVIVLGRPLEEGQWVRITHDDRLFRFICLSGNIFRLQG